MHDRWLGTGTSIKGGWIRQVIRAHTSPFSEICNNVIIFVKKNKYSMVSKKNTITSM
jgi:hypothetical protein